MKKSKLKASSYILLILVVVSGVLFFILAGKTGTGKIVQVSESDPSQGWREAPVTVVIFGDYKCGYTKQFFDEIYPWLKEKYIDPGKVWFVYKQFPRTETARRASEASLCAHDQGKFWAYNTVLLERIDEWSQRISTSEAEELFNPILGQYANELGLDEKTFLDCLSQHSHKVKIDQDYAYGEELGVSKTPALFVNSFMIDGTPSSGDFEAVLSKFI